ncbi:MAG: tRNA pseudouridine(55) synthase TruB [Gammaproteobacteria bacterium]
MKKKLRNIHGVLLVDKPKGISSRQAVSQVKYIYQAKKAGHTGSLDPLATGMLPICLGEATKFADYLLSAQKNYQVVAKLGQTTNTGDAEGEIIQEKLVTECMLANIDNILKHFRGNIQQIPPMYSAIKHQGQPLYKLARRGQTVDRAPREVTIYELERLSNDNPLQLSLQVVCSKGTYIRTLVEDIGAALGCGAHVLELRRLQVHTYNIDQMLTIDQIVGDIDGLLLPMTTLTEYLPTAVISQALVQRLRQGIAVEADFKSENTEGKWQILTETGEFLGLGERLDDNKISPKRLLVGL